STRASPCGPAPSTAPEFPAACGCPGVGGSPALESTFCEKKRIDQVEHRVSFADSILQVDHQYILLFLIGCDFHAQDVDAWLKSHKGVSYFMLHQRGRGCVHR